jgi:hypothetical protein
MNQIESGESDESLFHSVPKGIWLRLNQFQRGGWQIIVVFFPFELLKTIESSPKIQILRSRRVYTSIWHLVQSLWWIALELCLNVVCTVIGSTHCIITYSLCYNLFDTYAIYNIINYSKSRILLYCVIWILVSFSHKWKGGKISWLIHSFLHDGCNFYWSWNRFV